MTGAIKAGEQKNSMWATKHCGLEARLVACGGKAHRGLASLYNYESI